jgi:beta-lactamase superfamily II metal-dependent hydrolase
MSIVKSFSVGNGDMFYIEHNSDNFTIIDCCPSSDNRKTIVDEIKKKAGTRITRFISTHPDGDHIQDLVYLDDQISIVNFYVVDNEATKSDETENFKRYRELRDSQEAHEHREVIEFPS